ncbi:protein FAR1-RELATED SEQUENCE 5-like [Spinacia oleracea]|uniref:Protein FAR1-RELATED SEQUENCE 5-like n=1 Tax=Spinacia oleracea TaxID=3562 RepID=A0ABM3RGV4_SPIOL|nr:protein FAR1-RELATED SEQUENCE 5-like [Spinacia oleracea]
MEDVLNNCIENKALAEEPEEEESTNEIEAEEQKIISHSEEPVHDIVGTLMGYTGETVEEVLGFCEKHANAIGFSIRKGNTRFKIGTRIVLEKTFLCSTAGITNNGKNKKKREETIVLVVPKKERKPRQVPITITGCRACLRVKMNSEGRYEVVNHVIIQNHDLTRSQWHYLHRSESFSSKNVILCKSYCFDTHACVTAITFQDEKSLSSTASFKYMAIEAGGRKFRALEERPSKLLDKVKNEANIRSWNKQPLKQLHVWLCIHNIGDEKIESFVWLLQTFKKSMGGKSPISIFTDQDAAMNNAINQVFPDARHVLCVWHLHQNAITRFGALKRYPTFKKTFNYCLYKCVTEVEFETNWRSMLQAYELIGEEWFTNVYDLREKWCLALSKDFFSAGILSSQRSESTNHAIGFRANTTTSLTDFYRLFKGTIQRWRSVEKQVEFSCSKSVAFLALPLSGLLKHASEVYTLSLLRDFEEEFGYSIATTENLIWTQGDAVQENFQGAQGERSSYFSD